MGQAFVFECLLYVLLLRESLQALDHLLEQVFLPLGVEEPLVVRILCIQSLS